MLRTISCSTKISQCVYFPCGRFKLNRPPPSVRLYGTQLQYVSSVNYLGNQITSDLSDDESIHSHIRGFYTRANSLVRKFQFASPGVKRVLFNAYCSSMYCSQLWSRYTLGTMRKLRVAYNNAFRILFGYRTSASVSQMFVSHGVDSFEARRRKLTYAFVQRIATSENNLTIRLFHSDAFNHSTFWRHYLNLIFKHPG